MATVDPCRNEGLHHEAVQGLVAPLPVAAVDVEQDGTLSFAAKQVEPFPFGRTIGEIEDDIRRAADVGAALHPAVHQRLEVRLPAAQFVLKLELVGIHAPKQVLGPYPPPTAPHADSLMKGSTRPHTILSSQRA